MLKKPKCKRRLTEPHIQPAPTLAGGSSGGIGGSAAQISGSNPPENGDREKETLNS